MAAIQYQHRAAGRGGRALFKPVIRQLARHLSRVAASLKRHEVFSPMFKIHIAVGKMARRKR